LVCAPRGAAFAFEGLTAFFLGWLSHRIGESDSKDNANIITTRQLEKRKIGT
jgi:hypothetical protein